MDWAILGFQGLKEMLNVHPMIVHIPVALFPASLLFYLLGFVFKRRSLLVAGRACLYLAVLGAAAAVWSGKAAEETLQHNDRIHRLLEAHEDIGAWIGRLAWVLGAWSFFHVDQRPRFAPAFLALLAFTTLAVAQNSDLGGRMVYVEGAGVKAALPQMTGLSAKTPQTPHHHEHAEEEHASHQAH